MPASDRRALSHNDEEIFEACRLVNLYEGSKLESDLTKTPVPVFLEKEAL